jgi:hypothetical protein
MYLGCTRYPNLEIQSIMTVPECFISDISGAFFLHIGEN